VDYSGERIFMDVQSLVSGLVGGALSGAGVFKYFADTARDRWMETVKAENAKELENFKNAIQREQKALQVHLDRSVFVSKAQFDTEFNAMRDVFRLATDVWLAMEGLRPMFKTRPANETEADRLKALWVRWEGLAAAFNKFSPEIESLSPFYPKELHAVLLGCRGHAAIELKQVETGGEETFNIHWYTQAEDNRREFKANYSRAAVLIRDRLERLAVIPSL
jgi:hypothetical protein